MDARQFVPSAPIRPHLARQQWKQLASLSSGHSNASYLIYADMQKAEIAGVAAAVFKTTDKHSSEFLPVGTAYIEAEKLKKSLAEQSSPQ